MFRKGSKGVSLYGENLLSDARAGVKWILQLLCPHSPLPTYFYDKRLGGILADERA